VNALLQAVRRDVFSAPAQSLAIAVIYEDSNTHRQATMVFDALLRDLGDSTPLTATWWRTSLLTDPQLSKSAARAIADADLVMVSVRADRGPSSAIQEWIESWPRQSGRWKALVGLLSDDDEPCADAWNDLLRDVAARRGMIYLPGVTSAALEYAPRACGRPTRLPSSLTNIGD